MVDASGNTVVEYTYDSWGNVLSITGSLKDTVGVQNPFRYRGYYYDVETGMYYLRSRYYDPELCKFISADRQLNGSLLGYNLYLYCENNPVLNKDLSGRAADIALDLFFLGMDVVNIIKNPTNIIAYAELAGDAVSTIVPFLSGGGKLVRVVIKGDDVTDAAKYADEIVDSSKAIKSNPKLGTEIHGTYDPIDKNVLEKKKLINQPLIKWNSRLRPDALDDANKIIYELKPYNEGALKRGIKQTKRYQEVLGGQYTIVIDLYIQ